MRESALGVNAVQPLDDWPERMFRFTVRESRSAAFAVSVQSTTDWYEPTANEAVAGSLIDTTTSTELPEASEPEFGAIETHASGAAAAQSRTVEPVLLSV